MSVVKALIDASLWWVECQEAYIYTRRQLNYDAYKDSVATKRNAEEELFEAVKGYSKVFIE